MTTLIGDTETDGLLADLTKIHCLCLVEAGGSQIEQYHDHPDVAPRDGDMAAGLARLADADELVFHNGLEFDYPAIRKVYPDWRPRGRLLDSLVVGRSVWPDEHLKHLDQIALARRPDFPKELIGRHSLRAWGYRLKDKKGEQPDSWHTFTAGMLVYCAQDVVVLDLYWRRILAHQPTTEQIELEQSFAPIIRAMIDRGAPLDVPRTQALVGRLLGERAELDAKIRAAFPDFEDVYYTPKKKQRKTRVTVFNPGSRAHVARGLQEKHGWKPAAYTPSGQVQVDETILGALPYPEAKLVAERYLLQKKLGVLAEGKGAWLKLVTPAGRVHGYVSHNGAVTGRATHSRPNLGNVDASAEMRACWAARPGHAIVVADASGIQARVLAHYAYRFDDGDFARIVLDGDIHTQNKEAAESVLGRPATRAQAKVAFYAMLFGAQGRKVGASFDTNPTVGEEIRRAILDRLPGLQKVIAGVEADACARGFIRTFDGRRLWVRLEKRRGRTVARTALVILAQGGEAVLMKTAIVLASEWTARYQVLFVHDEIVLEVPAEMAEAAGAALEQAIVAAGVCYNLKVPLAAHVAIGADWSVK